MEYINTLVLVAKEGSWWRRQRESKHTFCKKTSGTNNQNGLALKKLEYASYLLIH